MIITLLVSWVGFSVVALVVLFVCDRWQTRTARLLDRIWNLPEAEPEREWIIARTDDRESA